MTSAKLRVLPQMISTGTAFYDFIVALNSVIPLKYRQNFAKW